ncbi:MAG: alpha/beta hydrolase, partial [Promethearchaeota archaeon]
MKNKNLKSQRNLIIIGVIIIFIGICFQPWDFLLQNFYARYQPVSFQSHDGVTTIYGFLYYPATYDPSKQYPAVVLVHGINSNSGVMIPLAVQLAIRGFMVLAINLRGHFLSSGYCTLSAREPLDIRGAIDWLFDRTDVNQTALGLVGHSLGGMSVIRAAAQDPRVNACVELGAPLSIENLLNKYVSNMDFTLFQLYVNLWNDLSNPTVLEETAPINVVNVTHPRNFLMCYGDLDYAATLEEQKSYLINATGNASAEIGVLYGDYHYGNATELIRYESVYHGDEPRHSEIIVDVINWMEMSLNGQNPTPLTTSGLLFWYHPVLPGDWIIFGGILFILVGAIPIVIDLFEKKKQKNDATKEIKEVSNGKSSTVSKYDVLKYSILCAGLLIGTAFLVPLSNLFLIPNLNFYRLAGVIVNLFVIQAMFLGPILVALILIDRKHSRNKSFKLSVKKRDITYSVLCGIVLASIFVFCIVYLPLLSGLNFIFPLQPLDIILLLMLLILSFLIQEIYM